MLRRRTGRDAWRMASLAALTVALGVSASAISLQQAAPAVAVDEAAATPIQRLGACLAGGGVGDVVLLIDESGSVRDTDPDDARTESAAFFAEQLAGYASANGASIDVQVATFAEEYRAVGPAWVSLDAGGVGEVLDLITEVSSANEGVQTDYWTALNGARGELAAQAAGRAPASSCQSIVWFSDGALDYEYDYQSRAVPPKGFAPDLAIVDDASAAEAARLAQLDLCRPGGLADQLRTSGVIVFGIGLDGAAAAPGTFDLMQAITTGGPTATVGACGSSMEEAPGEFRPASDLDGLLFAFDLLSTPGQAPIVQEDDVEDVHRAVVDGSTPRVSILAAASPEGVSVSIQSPSGTVAEIPNGGRGDSGVLAVDGASVTYSWKSDTAVSVTIDRAGATQWSGLWQLAFAPRAEQTDAVTSRSHIRVQGSLVPAWGTPATDLRQGEVVEDVLLGFQDRAGETADASIIEGSFEYRAIFRDSAGTETTIADITDVAQLAQPVAIDLADAALGAATVTLESVVTTAPTTFQGEPFAGTRLAPEVVTYAVTVLPPAIYPAIGTSVDFGGTDVDPVELHATLPVDGEGCLRILDETLVVAGPDGVDEARIVADQEGCLVASADGIPLTLTTTETGNGTLSGTFAVQLEAANAEEPLTTTVAFTADLARPVDAGSFWTTLVAAILVAVLLPLLLLLLAKWLASTIPNRMLYGFTTDVTIDGDEVLRDGVPFSIRQADGEHLVRMRRGTRRITIDGIDLRVRLGLSPFGLGRVVVQAPGLSSISSETPSSDRSGLRAVLPLAVHNSWVLLRTPGSHADSARMLVLLGGVDDATTGRLVESVAQRAPGRLRTLVAAESAEGGGPTSRDDAVSVGATPTRDPFAASTESDARAARPGSTPPAARAQDQPDPWGDDPWATS